MYLTSSRPDIMFAVCACVRYQVNTKVLHLHIVKRIFRYLKGQPKFGLWYPKDSPFDLVAYTNSDYAGASLDRKSTTGGCQFIGCRLISWRCKKQTVVANSTTKAEYVVSASCCGQVLWIQNQRLDYRRDLQFGNEGGVDCLPNDVIFEQLALMGERSLRYLSLVVNEEMDDSLERASTTDTSLDAEQDRGNIFKTQSKATPNEPGSQRTSLGGGPKRQDTMGDTNAQTRSENVSKFSNDPLLTEVNTPRSGEDSLKLNKLMELCTNLQSRVLALETTKATQALDFESLKEGTELVEESSKKTKAEITQESSSKKARDELEQERSKKQKLDEDKETAELKELVNIISDEEGIGIDAIPLAVKP
nr:hypothetical protein [Tanacetum cinerariifolium]